MSWLTSDEIRNKFNIQENAYESQLESASNSAALIIRRGVSDEIYAEATADNAPSDPNDLIRYQSIVESHSFLVMWFLIGNVGNKLGESGFIKSAQDSGSPAYQSNILTNQYLTPKELAEMKADYLNKSKLYMGDYGTIDIEADVVGEPEQSVSIASLKGF